MRKISVLILMLCTLATIANVTGDYKRRRYEDEQEGDSSRESSGKNSGNNSGDIQKLTEEIAKEKKLTQEKIHKFREELKNKADNDHKMTREQISKLCDEIRKMSEENRHQSSQKQGQKSGGGLLSPVFGILGGLRLGR